MSTRERAADRGARLARIDLASIGNDLRTARLSAGLSLSNVGRAVGLSYSQVGRIERAAHPSVSVAQLARIGAVVGLDVRIRAYPGPTIVRDAGQLALIDRLRARLHRRLRLTTEVPLAIGNDQRAWDAVMTGFEPSAPPLPVEAETRLYDIQAQIRRLRLKARDGQVEAVLLVVADTPRNRAAARLAGPTLGETFPLSPRAALMELGSGRCPGGSALIFL